MAKMKARRIIESFENPFRMVGDCVINPQYCLCFVQPDRFLILFVCLFVISVFALQ